MSYEITLFKLFLILIYILNVSSLEDKIFDSNECNYRIHRKCSYDQSFTEQEVENARIYIQKRFATTNPNRKACSKLRVRKEIKCLSNREVKDLIDVFLKLYENGVIEKMTKIHDIHWEAIHKFGEGLTWHRWFINQMEKEMLKINAKVTMPYWDYAYEIKSAQKSIVFDYFGHSGNKYQNYCVSDGPFANLTLNYPKPHCLKRQWDQNGRLPAWESAEWLTSINQIGITPAIIKQQLLVLFRYSSPEEHLQIIKQVLNEVKLTIMDPNHKAWSPYAVLLAFVAHFKTHLAIGGFNGDLSAHYAPNDPIFYLFHTFQADYELLKWQLTNDKNLVPKSYDLGVRLDWVSQKIFKSNIQKDFLTYYHNISVKETYEVGFGDLCYIHDQLIKPINKIIKNEKNELPDAIKRLRKALPTALFKRYFSKFAYFPERVTYFDYVLPEVGNCNPRQANGFCRKMPIAKRFDETPEGWRQWQQFVNNSFDISKVVSAAEAVYYKFADDLNKYNYCSPYA